MSSAPRDSVGWRPRAPADPRSELAVLKAELQHARAELQLGQLVGARERLIRLLTRLASLLSDVPAGGDQPDMLLLQASALTTFERAKQRGDDGAAFDRRPIRYAAAIDLFERALSLGGSADALERIDHALALAVTGRSNDAAMLLDTIPQEGTDAAEGDGLVDLGLAFWQGDELASAERALRGAAHRLPGNVRAVQKLAEVLGATGQTDEAAALYGEVAAAYGLHGDNERAVEAAAAGLALEPSDPRLVLQRARSLVDLDRTPEAIAELQRLPEAVADMPQAMLATALLLESTGEDIGARELLDRAATQGEDSVALHTAYARLDVRAGRLHEARTALEAAMRADPDDAYVKALLADIELKLGEAHAALATARAAVKLDSALAIAHLTESRVLNALGDHEGAIAAAAHAVELAPDDSDAVSLLAEALRLSGRLPEALGVIQRAEQLAPTSGWVAGTLGQILRALERHDDAIVALRRALELDPTLGWATMELADLLIERQELADALQVLDRALEMIPPDAPTRPALLSRRGDALRLADRLDDARAVLEEARALDAANPYTLVKLGQVLLAQGDAEGAVELLRQAMDLSQEPSWIRPILIVALSQARRTEELFDQMATAEQEGFDRSLLSTLAVSRRDEEAGEEEGTRERGLLEAAVTQHPDSALLRFVASQWCAQDAEWLAALQAAERAARLARDWPEAQWQHFGLLIANERIDEAEAMLDRLLDESKGETPWLEPSVDLLLHRERAEDAEKLLREIIDRHPERKWARVRLGRLLSARGRSDEAEHELRVAADDGTDADAVEALADLLRGNGRADEALELLDNALDRLAEVPAGVHRAAAEARWDRGELDAALNHADRAAALAPEDATIAALGGAILAAKGDHKPALARLVGAVELDPVNPLTTLALGWELASLGRFADAVAIVEPTVEKAPDAPEAAVAVIAQAHYFLRHDERAVELFEDLVKRAPTNRWYLIGRGDAMLACRHRDPAHATVARELFANLERELRERPEEPPEAQHALLGWTLYRLGRFEDAVGEFRRSLAIDSSDLFVQFNLALATFCGGGTLRRAKSEFQRGIDSSRGSPTAASVLRPVLHDLTDAIDSLASHEARDRGQEIAEQLNHQLENAMERQVELVAPVMARLDKVKATVVERTATTATT